MTALNVRQLRGNSKACGLGYGVVRWNKTGMQRKGAYDLPTNMSDQLNNSIWIPENKHGIKVGVYSANEIVGLLRDNRKKPKVIYFLADMLEE